MLGEEAVLIIGVLAALFVKHCIFDFFLQTPYQYLNKGTYGHPGGILHAGLHAIGSIPALLILPPGFFIGAAIVVGEFVIHYHIDWSKEQLQRRWQIGQSDAGYYRFLGVDQLLHQLTYLGIVAVLVASS